MSIEQQNRIIATFMGAELYGEDWHIEGRDMTVNNKKFPQSLRYHSSWSWLMAVVEKIETLYDGSISVKIYDWRCTIEIGTQYAMAFDVHIPDFYEREENKIDAVYKACIAFIQWHNQQNTSPI